MIEQVATDLLSRAFDLRELAVVEFVGHDCDFNKVSDEWFHGGPRELSGQPILCLGPTLAKVERLEGGRGRPEERRGPRIRVNAGL
jgi:hypothetical protein